MSRKLTEQIPSESRLVDAALKENLKTIFERLERPLCLKAVLEPDQRECTEMGAFLKAVGKNLPYAVEIKDDAVPENNGVFNF